MYLHWTKYWNFIF